MKAFFQFRLAVSTKHFRHQQKKKNCWVFFKPMQPKTRIVLDLRVQVGPGLDNTGNKYASPSESRVHKCEWWHSTGQSRERPLLPKTFLFGLLKESISFLVSFQEGFSHGTGLLMTTMPAFLMPCQVNYNKSHKYNVPMNLQNTVYIYPKEDKIKLDVSLCSQM